MFLSTFTFKVKFAKYTVRQLSTSVPHQKQSENENQRGEWKQGSAGGGSSNYQKMGFNRLTAYFRALKWTPIPLGVGFALLCYQHVQRVTKRNADPNRPNAPAAEWEVTSYRMVPLRSFSRLWGWVHSINLPVWARTPFYHWFAKRYHCDINEAAEENLEQYRNLGEFFRRRLKDGVRPICKESAMVSPVDGTVLTFGQVNCGYVEQVKGVSYSLPAFLGPLTWDNNCNKSKVEQSKCSMDREQYWKSLLKNENSALYHCVLYLAPGDYHRFHSPTEWIVKFRRHFTGELLSVNPSVAGRIAELFSLNERVVYVGEWEHGFFSYAAIGATNVGSIKIYGDEELTTNSRRLKKNTSIDKYFKMPLALNKGEDFGEFNLGSTVVLIFEAPRDFEFSIRAGCKIRVGQSLFKSKKISAFQ